MSVSVRVSHWGVLALGALVLSVAGAAADGAPIGSSNRLVVLRSGDGTTVQGASGAAVFLEEFHITSYDANNAPLTVTHVQTIALPKANVELSGSNRKLVIQGSGSLEGGLRRSTNGQYVTFGGYDSTVGGSIGASATVARVVGRLDLATGLVDTSTSPTDVNSANNAIRSVLSDDGTHYWMGFGGGTAATQGVRYMNHGATTSTQLSQLNTRRVDVHFSQLYVGANSTAGPPLQGVGTLGSGMPTTSGQAITALPGVLTAAAVDFFLADAQTLYVANEASNAAGGVQKYIFNSGTNNWDLVFTKTIDVTAADHGAVPTPIGTFHEGLRGLSGHVDGAGNVVLFGTTTFAVGSAQGPNYLVGISDTLTNTSAAGAHFNVLADSGDVAGGAERAVFRGVDDIGIAIPEPAGLAALGAGVLALVGRGRRRE